MFDMQYAYVYKYTPRERERERERGNERERERELENIETYRGQVAAKKSYRTGAQRLLSFVCTAMLVFSICGLD